MDTKVLDAVIQLKLEKNAVLATVISTKGSTPRKAGSQILFYPDGYSVGTIGGGCGENEVRRHALNLMQNQGIAHVVQVDLTQEIAESEGMICGGTMEIFIERLGKEK